MPLKNALMLLATALIWGTAFVAQQVGGGLLGAFTFASLRFPIGGLVLLPVLAVLRRTSAGERGKQEDKPPAYRRNTWTGGLLCGLVLFGASSLQQVGIAYTSVGKAGFITALYILFVPLLGIFARRRVGVKLWVSVAVALAGLYLLCIKDSLRLEWGDTLMILCAVVFSLHILVIDHFSPKADGVAMSCIQFFVAGLLSVPCMLLWETLPSAAALQSAGLSVLYVGILSCGVAYTLQIVGQRGTNPTVASLILSLEAVVSVLAAGLLLGQSLSPREGAGACLMFAAIILAQLPGRSGRIDTA
jgi:drug/metabolite transporter (DMT)-like permease